ncbi:UDP-N-acetylmuramoylalanine--D-glutamate ligase [Corynebacterium mustelae]|uniref:UDP-N-acetylmuramoylalanine--D-glutamate ligase n=1 Tax=Corynebacterium mustelae TaxID=571915 RepID=A0A0G3H5P7_9CORY|nr:UDP-N-acetylmuramoyl-L-alanine--D-glutamate ligase [Corynebacterium mustelae]AKK06482.1 UDP-N-acetylmuramoylalanine--D-glutamate ligase [Corynebacterium mustelae]
MATETTETATAELPLILAGPVLVTGAGISGRGIAQLLTDLGVSVEITDENETAVAEAAEATGAVGISVAQAQERLGTYSCVVTSPGWPPTAKLLVAAAEAGLEVVGDVEVCYLLDQAKVFGPSRSWLVVTGTNGKTTATAMLAAMLVEAGAAAVAVGNIGVSVADALTSADRADVLVVEMSSFQLHWSKDLVPEVGILLNLAEDHIDWHGSMAEYAAAKAKVLKAPIAVVGADDPLVMEQVAGLETTENIVGFSLAEPMPGQLGIREGKLVDATGMVVDGDELTGESEVVLAEADGIQPPGTAGIYDALAAAGAARAVGVSAAQVSAALATFEVAGHRGQVVAEKDGIVAVDNSKATNPHAADSALSGYESIVWIAGGQLKDADVSELIATHAKRLKAVAVLGADREVIAAAVEKLAPGVEVFVTDATDPEEAMSAVCAWAVTQAESGDAIVLAPAAASLDMYSGMAHRGNLFTQYISEHLGAHVTDGHEGEPQ